MEAESLNKEMAQALEDLRDWKTKHQRSSVMLELSLKGKEGTRRDEDNLANENEKKAEEVLNKARESRERLSRLI